MKSHSFTQSYTYCEQLLGFKYGAKKKVFYDSRAFFTYVDYVK